MQPLLHIDNLNIEFVADNVRTEAVKNISLVVNKGEIVALVGESGSGKSVTALSILQLLPSPPAQYRGRIFFSDGPNTTDLQKLSAKELQEVRGNKISMIFQEPMSSLNPVMKCGEQVMEVLLQHKSISSAEAKNQTINWLEKVKLPEPEKIFFRYPHQLSGGQKQRVMIAMAMCCQPQLLICDEPTTALDVTVQKSILQLIKELVQQENTGVLFITHDLGVVYQFADTVAIMYKGELIEQNSVAEIFNQPQQPYTNALLACRPAQHPKGEKLPIVSNYLEPTSTDINVLPGKIVSDFKSTSVLAEIKNLSVSFPTKKNIFGTILSYYKAIDDVSFKIFKGETLGLVGESGCGKTTLGRTLLGLIEPSAGSIVYNNVDITSYDKNQLKNFRKELQLVFQDPFSSLNPRLTIGEAIEEPLRILLKHPKSKRDKTVRELLEKVNLSPAMASRYPHEFSGGQRQRIVIARALALNPGMLVCDESVSALDVSVQAQVLNLLNDLKREFNLTMLFISHDLSVVRYMCDRMLVMQKGKIVESGNAEEIYNHPQSAYTKELLQSIPKAVG